MSHLTQQQFLAGVHEAQIKLYRLYKELSEEEFAVELTQRVMHEFVSGEFSLLRSLTSLFTG